MTVLGLGFFLPLGSEGDMHFTLLKKKQRALPPLRLYVLCLIWVISQSAEPQVLEPTVAGTL